MSTVVKEAKNVVIEAKALIQQHGMRDGLVLIAREGAAGVRIALSYGMAFAPSNSRLHRARFS